MKIAGMHVSLLRLHAKFVIKNFLLKTLNIMTKKNLLYCLSNGIQMEDANIFIQNEFYYIILCLIIFIRIINGIINIKIYMKAKMGT
jgi:hypothetical protein